MGCHCENKNRCSCKSKRQQKQHRHHKTEKNCCGDKKQDCCFAKKESKDFEKLRRLCPNEPVKLGTSTKLVAEEYENMPFQAGNVFSNGLKLEYDEKSNKYSLPGLKVKKTFDLVPSVEEAGDMNDEILAAGYDKFPRDLNSHWYGVTQDEDNFYYACWGGRLFGAFLGFGTSSLLIARKKSNASLVWVKNAWNYNLDIPYTPNFVGGRNMLARIALAIYKDKLYVTCITSNIGPQLYCLDKKTGNRIWTMAYYLPEQVIIDTGKQFLVTPETPFNSFDSSSYAVFSLGDLNIVVAELQEGIPSVFVGVASNQNALNPGSFTGFPVYTDQGQLVRIDDLGLTATIAWRTNTCAPLLKTGDVISNVGPDEFNPFRPGSDIVYIWRDTTETGRFSSIGGADAAILDYTGANPGYIPQGHPTENNNTTPIVANIFLFPGAPDKTEDDVPNVFRTPFPGIGANPVIYDIIFFTSDINPPQTITELLAKWNFIQSSLGPNDFVKITYWSYIDNTTVLNVNAANFGPSNAGVRYIAYLPNGYTIENAQEAEGLNYYGNSLWGNAPCLDIKRGLIYFGTAQAHSSPIDEILYYLNPKINYLDRKQDLINRGYEYARPDSSTDGAPFATLTQVNDAKDAFIKETKVLNLQYTDKSPRGNRSYSDSIMGANLFTGEIEFGYRSVPWDSTTFTADDPSLVVIEGGFLDGDVSSGIMLFENIELPNGNYGTMLVTQPKASILTILDISGLNPDVKFDNTNLLEKGLVPDLYYTGPDGALGGSNYGHAQDGGSLAVWSGANDAEFEGSFSFTYNTGYNEGAEIHITRDGRSFQVHESYVSAFDVSKREIVWETPLSSQSHANVSIYNGIAYIPDQIGILYGMELEKGEVVWKEEVADKYGMAGISAPSFAQGQAVWINNYVLNFDPAEGRLGNTGLLLDVDKCLLTTPKDTVKNLVGNSAFVSFDVTPRAKNPLGIKFNLVLNQQVDHVWDCEGNLTATHFFVYEDGTEEETELKFKAKKFIYSSNKIIFENYPTQNGYRYISLRMLNRKTYILKYQRFEYGGIPEEGEWVNYEATLQFAECFDEKQKHERKVTEIKSRNVEKKDVEKKDVEEKKLSGKAGFYYKKMNQKKIKRRI